MDSVEVHGFLGCGSRQGQLWVRGLSQKLASWATFQALSNAMVSFIYLLTSPFRVTKYLWVAYMYKGLRVGGQTMVTHCGPALKRLAVSWEGKTLGRQILQPVIETTARENDQGHSQPRLDGQGNEPFRSECS